MTALISVLSLISALLFLFLFGGLGVLSLFEGEYRAMTRAILVGLAGGAVCLSVPFLPSIAQTLFLGTAALLPLTALILFLSPIGQVQEPTSQPQVQVDERETMFARARLESGTPEYTAYYKMHPEHKEGDDRSRRNPGLLSSQAQLTDPRLIAATEASFQLTESLRGAVNGPVAPQGDPVPTEQMTGFIKSLVEYHGALDVGITKLKPYHIYSHIGRGSGEYGAEIKLDHTHAIAFTVEMDFQLTRTAPHPPLTLESGRQYVRAAQIAIQVASAVRNLGHPARAHIDGNYRVIAPLVARDAGLGEIGRMGLLMTPQHGPRVRLGVVTTSLELLTDSYQPMTSMIDFCEICQKCAHNCPSQSIPAGDRRWTDGALRWKINPDTCYRYWTVVGTDCGRCMAVCPFSHPDNPFHNLVRWGIKRSGAFRRFALWMDDFFYGKVPEPIYEEDSVPYAR